MNFLDSFKSKTGYNVRALLEKYTEFTRSHYQNIVSYYNGAEIDRESFRFYEDLRADLERMEAMIDQYSNSFDTTDFWTLNNSLSDMLTVMETCENMGRWQRSSRQNTFSTNIKVQHIQKQNETIERISRDAGFSDEENWSKIAIQNQIIEEDYTNKGGKLLTVSLPNSQNFTLDNIVDYLSSDNIYGKDVVKKLEIMSDGDLNIVSGRDNLEQIFTILLNTLKGSIPEFPEDGIPDYIFGANENIIQYPIIFRSLLSMLQKDRRFTSLDIIDIKKDQDSIFIELQASTITGDTFTRNVIFE